MSQELNFHKNWNIIKTKFHKNINITRTKTKTTTKLNVKKLKFLKNLNVKKNVTTVISKKKNCYKNWNITKLKEERKELNFHKIGEKKNIITVLPQNWNHSKTERSEILRCHKMNQKILETKGKKHLMSKKW